MMLGVKGDTTDTGCLYTFINDKTQEAMTKH